MFIKLTYHRLLMVAVGIYIQTAVFSQADIILTNGKIFTADISRLYVQAIAIKDNKIMATGANAEIIKLATANTQRIDLQTKTVVPGFNDAHDHPGWFAQTRKSFNPGFSVPGIDKAAMIDSVARLIKLAEPGEWISGFIGLTVFNDPSVRTILDSLAPHNPVQLQNMWGHGLILNSYALKLLGIADDEPDPLGGWYVRKAGSTLLTGAMHEYAQWPVWKAVSAAEPNHYIEALKVYSEVQLAMGITTVQFMCFDYPGFGQQSFSAAHLAQRVRIIPFPGTTKTGRALNEWTTINKNPSPLLYVSGVKYLIDGTPFEQGGLFKQPYSGSSNWYGRLDMPVDTIRQILKEAYHSNTQLLLHIVGDSSLSLVLSLMKQTGTNAIWKTKRVRFEHNSTGNATAEDIQRIHDMGIIMAHTPQYSQNSLLQSLLKKGIVVSISPDGTTNPFADIQVITSQQKNAAENLSVEQAVIAYTKTNAYAEFTEKEKGTLMPGMLADLVVLSQDIFSIPKEQIPITKSVLTMVNGKIVYKR